MSELAQWLTFLAVGVGTFILRVSFIEFHGALRIPPLLRRALAYVPAAVLAALVLPAVMVPDRHADFDWNNPQIPAAIVAGLVAWKTRSTLLTLVVGMAVLLALRHWAG